MMQAGGLPGMPGMLPTEAPAAASSAARAEREAEAKTALSGLKTGFLSSEAAKNTPVQPSLIPSLCTHFTRAGIEWRR